jgi:glycosyltransferase involved in cell wall biosynthesis
VSDAERTQLVDLGAPAERVRTLDNPIVIPGRASPAACHAFRTRWELGDSPVVLCLGKLTPRKRVDLVIAAFADLQNREARLVIAGNDMGERRRLERWVSRLGLCRSVRFTGLLTGHARLGALASASVVAHPATDEVFGLAPVEALLCGTPVIVADDSGCGQLVARTGGGLVVRSGSRLALAHALGQMLGAREHWRERAVGAGRVARELCDPDRIAAATEALYLEAISSSREARRAS